MPFGKAALATRTVSGRIVPIGTGRNILHYNPVFDFANGIQYFFLANHVGMTLDPRTMLEREVLPLIRLFEPKRRENVDLHGISSITFLAKKF